MGRLTLFDATQNTAMVEYKDASLRLNTELVDVYAPIGAMIQCIGEVKYDKVMHFGRVLFDRGELMDCFSAECRATSADTENSKAGGNYGYGDL